MIVRRAVQDDMQVIADFNVAMAQETEQLQLSPATVQAGVRALMADESLGFYLVAEIETQVVGALLVTNEWSDWRNGVFWWIQSVYVLPEFRRQGIYRALYRRVQDLAKDHSVCGFRLYVEKDNKQAQATYQRLGMVETQYRMFEQRPT